MVREFIMKYFDEEVYADDSELWDDPDFQDLTYDEKKIVAELIRNLKITVH